MGQHTGFTSYLTTGKITDEFINDFTYWIKVYYKRWSLFTSFDDFTQICWESLLRALPEFNPEVATIQTFCISRINNECWRIYMKNKVSKPEDDIDDPVVNCDIEGKPNTDLSFFNAYSEHCFRLGIKVDIQTLYEDYVEGFQSDAVKAFCWWMSKEKLS